MIEIEKRVLLNKKDFVKLSKFLKTKGKLTKQFNRFTIVYVKNKDFTPNQEEKIDLKVRTTKEGGKLALKYGNWHDAASREEYEIDFNINEIGQLINILRISGYVYYVITYIHRVVFSYQDFTITLDKHYSHDDILMEVELLSESKSNIPEFEKRIDKFLNEHQLKSLSSKETIQLISELNSIKKLRVDFTKTNIDGWIKKWKKFIYCQYDL